MNARKYLSIAFFLVVILSPRALLSAEKMIPQYNLSVAFDIEKNILKGSAEIILPPGKTYLQTGNLKVISATLGSGKDQPTIRGGLIEVLAGMESNKLDILFEGSFPGMKTEDAVGNPGVFSDMSEISSRGVCLMGTWYPQIISNSPVNYRLKAVVPKDFDAVSEAEEIVMTQHSDKREFNFIFPHPVQWINFVAGRYSVIRDKEGDIDVYGYFFGEDSQLASNYIEYTKKYLKTYGKMFGRYPYKRFSVVENFLQTGSSMPAFTLLGSEVIKLPFIVETSLGHEVLHQWFGNSVFVDYESGNWSEALTTYLSDHLFEEELGRGAEYRKGIILDYQNRVTPQKESALRNFSSRTDEASKAIGYGKGAMVFHMLRKIAGDNSFNKILERLVLERQFRKTSWIDIQRIFEVALDTQLDWFFNQWLDRGDIPSVEITNPQVIERGQYISVLFDVTQKTKSDVPYIFDIEVTVKTESGETKETFRVEKLKQKFEIKVSDEPVELIADSNYDVMRMLTSEEMPPVISKLLGAEKKIVIVPQSGKDIYSPLIDILKKEGFNPIAENEAKDAEIRKSSVLIVSFDGATAKRFSGGIEIPASGFTLFVRKNPLNSDGVVAFANASSEEDASYAAKKIFHYGKYSFIKFEIGKKTEKRTTESANGIILRLSEPIVAIETSKATTFEDIIPTIFPKDIVYVGEAHTRYEDHKLQLLVIKAFHKQNPKMAIGMEMFQKPFQKAIDDYLSGKSTLKDFLKLSEYFKRWVYDYNLYREIIAFAKFNKIPVVALNTRSEIIQKVSSSGFDNLTPEERKEIPAAMDMGDDEYRGRLRDVFERHSGKDKKTFEYFYQSQIIWDESMAYSVDNYLKENPDYKIVVLAGAGHLIYGSGIPQRAYRLNKRPYTVLMNGSDDAIERNIADFFFYPKPVYLPETPKLMVALKEEKGAIKIESFSPGSVSEKAGLKLGDAIFSLDGQKIEGIDDVRIALLEKRSGDNVVVKILRKRFLLKDKELEFNVSLQ